MQCVVFSNRHVATVVSGTELARQIHKEIQTDVAKLLAQGNRRPHLSVILVGDDHASHTYVRNKTRTASLLGKRNETQDSKLSFWSDQPRVSVVGSTYLNNPHSVYEPHRAFFIIKNGF